MSSPTTDPLHLDDEQLRWVRDCLDKAGIDDLGPSAFKDLRQSIEAGIQGFLDDTRDAGVTYREKHDQIRDLVILAEKGDIEALISKIETLPEMTMLELDRWGAQRTSRLGQKTFGKLKRRSWTQETWEKRGGFRGWARRNRKNKQKIIQFTYALAVDGATLVPGRRRPHGKQSRARVEPRIMSVARGSSDDKEKGGKPDHTPHFILISRLGAAWQAATGRCPNERRSDWAGFGELVHHVFGWLKIAESQIIHSANTMSRCFAIDA